ncbi:MAG TPA: RNA 2',3'-cyclic phosphodiesterase [Bacteroides sp.]|nr:RNA 2',3'-cyclic phosphodiesterase [Bacteroides sp.]
MKEQYYRTFIGVPLRVGPLFLEAREELMEILAGERISWVHPSRYHVTMRFIGNTRQPAISRISRALEETTETPVKQHITLGDLGSFGDRVQPRVLWVGVRQPEFLNRLKEMTDAALDKCGIRPEKRVFSPHLTLGRIRNRVDPAALQSAVKTMKDRFGQEVLLDRLVYFRSEPGNGGPVYTPISSLMFRDQEV